MGSCLSRICCTSSRVRYLAGIRHRVAAIAVGHHLQNVGPLPSRAHVQRAVAGRPDRATSMPSTCSPGMAKDTPRWERSVVADERSIEVPMAYLLFSMMNTTGSFHSLRHVEALVDLALIGGAVAEVGEANAAVVAIAVGEGEAGAERHVGADDAVAAVEVLILGEHVHRAALAL